MTDETEYAAEDAAAEGDAEQQKTLVRYLDLRKLDRHSVTFGADIPTDPFTARRGGIIYGISLAPRPIDAKITISRQDWVILGKPTRVTVEVS